MKVSQFLGYLGLLPFMVALGLFVSDLQQQAQTAFIFYSAVILSFIAGTLWQPMQGKAKGKQQILSNLFSLTAFGALLLEKWLAVLVLAMGYLLLYWYERRGAIVPSRSESYLRMRGHLTFTVVAMHLAMSSASLWL